jgi:hypothetical protein
VNHSSAAADPTPITPIEGWGRLRDIPTWIVASVFAGLSWRELQLVNTHAVNMMYGDQFDIYQPMFLGQGWWETFVLQHGPHREGAGLIFTRAMASVSGWNTRWDAFAASILMIGAALLGIRLANRFGVGRRSLLLAAVPLLFLNVHQYEIFVGAVNLSYASMPVLLLMALCLSWFVESDLWRSLAIGSLTFLLIFTGFGLFAGLLTPPLVLVDAIQSWRKGRRSRAWSSILALALAALGWALFSRGYVFEPAVPGFRFPYEHPLQYGVFVARMLGNFYGTAVLSAWQLVVGIAAAAALVATAVRSGYRCFARGMANDTQAVVLFCLAGFAILFCANCAIGRVFTGPIAPLAPRYAALLIPAGLAIFLQLAQLRTRRNLAWLGMAYVVLLIPGTSIRRADEIYGANWYADGMRSWKAAYLASHDQAKADQVAHFPVYPGPIDEKLTFLEDRHLNLFLPER